MKPRPFAWVITARRILPLLFITLLATPALTKPSMVVSIAPMAWLLQQVAGDQVEIITLIPPGASPHSYEITPRQMAALAQADIFFSLDLPLERHLLARLRASLPNLTVVELNQGLSLRYFNAAEQEFEEQHEHQAENAAADEHQRHMSEPDPHTWLNPQNASMQAANMAQALKGRVEHLEENLARLQTRLAEADARLALALAPFKGQTFLVYHPAFGYLAERYQLQQVAVEMEGKEPTPRRLALLVEQAKAQGIKIIFVQPQFPQAAVERLAREIQGAVVVLDPLAYNYLDNLEDMVKNLQVGL